jgi:hypothetical protein
VLERTVTWRWVAALLGLAVLVGCTSPVSSGRESTPTTAVTATRSHVTGQPKENHLAGSCVPTIVRPPSSPGLAATTWPTEHADVWRTHAAAAGLPTGLGQMKLRTATATLPPVPVWGYVGTGREVYVIGGAPYLLDMFTKLIEGAPRASVPLLLKQSEAYSKTMTPYVARVDTQTMKVQVLYLSDGTSINYTGGLLVHSNGYLYAVARSVLYKIDPSTFTIVKTRQLPLAPTSSGSPNENTAYNGIQVTQNGDLILKGWASTGGGPNPPGILLRVDPMDLSIKAQLVSSDVASARMTLVTSGGQEYLYFPNSTQSVRFLVKPTAFVYDAGWSQTYLTEKGDTTASSDVFMGDGVVFANNTDPTATTPMRVFAQDTAGSTLQSTQAFGGNGPAWNFFMMAGDPYKSGILAVEDQLNGRIAGYLACSGGRTVQKLWENDSLKPSAGAAIDYKTGQLYVDDRRCTSPNRCRLFLVVLDLRTGRELARVAVAGTKPSIGQIFIGPNAVYYIATDTNDPNGYLTRVTATRG